MKHFLNIVGITVITRATNYYSYLHECIEDHRLCIRDDSSQSVSVQTLRIAILFTSFFLFFIIN